LTVADAAAVADDGLARRVTALVRDVPDYPTPGVLFKDITPLLATPAVFREVVDAIAAAHGRDGAEPVDVVAGIEARGFILAAPVALALDVPFVPIRKRGKLPHTTVAADYDLEYGTATIELRSGTLPAGARVLVVDDVLATGGTAAAGAELVERGGGVVVGLAFLMELDGLGGRGRLAGRDVTTLVHVGS